MRGRVTLVLLALMVLSCSKEDMYHGRDIDYEYGRNLNHGAIVLGERLDNPYKTENVARALRSLYPTKADRVELKSTDLYVRFLPEDKDQCDLLENMGLHLVDHPLDYDVVVEGDWHDSCAWRPQSQAARCLPSYLQGRQDAEEEPPPALS